MLTDRQTDGQTDGQTEKFLRFLSSYRSWKSSYHIYVKVYWFFLVFLIDFTQKIKPLVISIKLFSSKPNPQQNNNFGLLIWNKTTNLETQTNWGHRAPYLRESLSCLFLKVHRYNWNISQSTYFSFLHLCRCRSSAKVCEKCKNRIE